ncbi:MBL fold metallo-hydrolase [Gracilimonas tropica]|uniref:MBL fold metallo-hydrolase n=1 Tax=Gracilimonas tropica TaxID=454600 RepID=UPI00039A8B11|nr:MBL fold metallo-hydrolase [Gracilimonas tropica]
MTKHSFNLLLLLMLPSFLFAQLNNNPDQIQTNNGELIIHPILHGSVIFEWDELSVYVDPWGDVSLYAGKPEPDIILITHPHGDHLSPETLGNLDTENVTFIVPKVVAEQMPDEYSDRIDILNNGESMDINGINVSAIPMYNLPNEGARHTKGWGNGYVLTIDGKRIYVSGDTEDIPEMRNLEEIDVAFVCMNLPYTMDIYQAASAVLDFEPAIMYPYHHRGQDIVRFKEIVDAENKEIEVRLKNWYPN